MFQQRVDRGISIFDIDETLTLRSARKDAIANEALAQKTLLEQQGRPYDPGIWDDFHRIIGEDQVNPHMEGIFRAARDDHSVVMLTARGQGGRDTTINWLRDHDMVPDALITRPLSLDGASSAHYKDQMIRRRIPTTAKIHALYDDSKSVLAMAEGRGINAVEVRDHVPQISTARRQQMQQENMHPGYLGMRLDRIQSMHSQF